MNRVSGESGFSIVDVMIAVTILLVGIMSLVSAITFSIVGTTKTQQQLLAKQFATSTVEAIFSARDIDVLGFPSIGNVGDPNVPEGIFLSGVQPIYNQAGPDGIVGTEDDNRLDGGDTVAPIPGFQRRIDITDVPDPDRPSAPITMRRIEVTIFYAVGGARLTENMVTYAALYNR